MREYFIKLIIGFMILSLTACGNSKSEVVGEYRGTKSSGVFLKSDNKAYALGSNKKGMPIFKDTDKAFNQAIIDYREGFKAIEKEYNLKGISKKNWEVYKTYGWQLTSDNEELRKEGVEITKFLDIYMRIVLNSELLD